MKLEDAPPPGWYPDPERSARLRWWEGTDWSDEIRAIPSPTELANTVSAANDGDEAPAPRRVAAGRPRTDQLDTDRIVAQVRTAAREEVDRAAELFAHRIRSAINHGRSVVANRIDPVVRWLKIAVVVVAVAVVAWFVLQFIAQITLLEWLGDRIDNITG